MAKRKERPEIVKGNVEDEGITADAKTLSQCDEAGTSTEDLSQAKIWEIELTETCANLLAGIKDQRVKAQIAKRIDGLRQDPDKQGKPLMGELGDLRILRAVGQSYRIIYRVDEGRVVVLVVSLGIRKDGDKSDVYALTKKLLKLGLLDE